MPLAAAITKKRAMGFLLECLDEGRGYRLGRGGILSRDRVAIGEGKPLASGAAACGAP